MSIPINRLEAAWKAWNGDPNDAKKIGDLGRAIREVVAQKAITMQDVLLACGELSHRERVAVQWVLDRVRVPREALSNQWHDPKKALPEIGEQVLVEVMEERTDDYFDVWPYDPQNQYWHDGTVIRWRHIH